ncbi:histidine phosphatase family protein [Mycobacterium heckeshornense]|nr:histidine phosphatase family protein [Mycobacterium heckeshornense]PIJ33298.1 histidine phosphatase family protein [Mycobacterium heckeshornense]
MPIPSFLSCRDPGIASVGPAADKSGDLARHVRACRFTVGHVGGPVRTLVLLRHAKSAYPDGVADHERPLAPRGEREAGLAGDWLRKNVPAVDAVLCSTATRARQTLAHTGIDAPVRYLERLYGATPAMVIDEINSVADDIGTLLVVGHEPTISELAIGLAGAEKSNIAALERLSVKFPTSALAVLQASASWKDLALGGAALVDFHVPR